MKHILYTIATLIDIFACWLCYLCSYYIWNFSCILISIIFLELSFYFVEYILFKMDERKHLNTEVESFLSNKEEIEFREILDEVKKNTNIN